MHEEKIGAGVLEAFEPLEDPRRVKSCAYPLQEMLMAALCAVASEADDWVHVVIWAEMKLDWLRRFLPFENGIASHDTFSRLFSILDSQKFGQCFIAWMGTLCPSVAGELIAIDGKSLRGSQNGDAGMAHVVSAWHSGAGVTLGQIKTAAKSNEIRAIPQLLEGLDIRGATLTIDAMGCQREIVQMIVDKQADYIVAVKNNQPKLAQAVETLLHAADKEEELGAQQHDITVDKDHGRLETRRCVVATELKGLEELTQAWPGLKSVAVVKSTREFINGRDKGKVTQEWRYYISSRQLDAKEFNRQVRAHWSIENSCHWVLDVIFGEDACRVRRDHGAENMGLLRRISLNLMKGEPSKGSMKGKRKRAAWSTDYLESLLGLKSIAQALAPNPQ